MTTETKFNPYRLVEIQDRQAELLKDLKYSEWTSEYFERFPERQEEFDKLEQEAKEERKRFRTLTKEEQDTIIKNFN